MLVLTGAYVPVRWACAVEATGTREQTHSDLPHPIPLQEDEEARLAGQAAIVIRAGQTAALANPR